MFKVLAELGVGRRHMVPQAAPARCNDNRPERRLAAALKHARPQLTCHWGAAAAGGRLECHWEIEPADETTAETPGPRCTTPAGAARHSFAWHAANPGCTAVRRG